MNPLASIAYDIGQELEAGNIEAAIAKLDLLKSEIERANCKHPPKARLWTYAVDFANTYDNGKPTYLLAYRCDVCGRYVVVGP